MKAGRSLAWVLSFVFLALPLSGETWYVRPDGGSRYSAKVPTGQCDGKADTPYHGKGVNQHCAFNDFRFLWDDRSYGNSVWVIAGGDTVILRGGPWRIGFNQGLNANDVWCSGGNGAAGCVNPKIPSGTPTQHTRILGENYASCSTEGATDRSKLTQIFGGYGVWTTLNLGSAQYVDVECLEITSHAQCATHGDPVSPRDCRKDYPLDDFDSDGISTDVHTHDILLQDLWIHGHTDRGVKGAIGGVVTAERVDIAYNGMAGWDFDDGNSTPSVNGVWNFKDSTIEWSGCNQRYPEKFATACFGQSSGGYGDGVGTPGGTCLAANIDHSNFSYNTQDGLDLGHGDTGNNCPLTITNSIAIGNGGATFKWGPNENPAVFTNNVAIANCARMSAPIEGQPAAFNAHLSDFCRAGDAISFNFRQGGRALLANNTIITYSPATFDLACWDPSCSNATFTFMNNIVLGYDNSKTYELGGKPGGPIDFYFQQPLGHIYRSNNLFYGIRNHRCLTSEKCEDPKFIAQPKFSKEQDLDNFNFRLSPSSPARDSGTRVPEVRTDYDGKPRPATGNYDMGAVQH